MAKDDEGETSDARAKPLRLPMLIGLVLALVGGGGGFYAARAGLLPFGGAAQETDAESSGQTHAEATDLAGFVYVPIEPLVISFADRGQSRHLRFRAELEVPDKDAAEVSRVMPRIVDVLNTYLRALKIADLEESTALPRLRAQMLRRVQAVVGRARVNDLLVMEFVLN